MWKKDIRLSVFFVQPKVAQAWEQGFLTRLPEWNSALK